MPHLNVISTIVLASVAAGAAAQKPLTLDSCRQLALSAGKQMAVAAVKRDVAKNMRRAAHTKYLPQVSAMGGYVYSSREISILSKRQQNAISHLGTAATAGAREQLGGLASGLSTEQILQIDGMLAPFGLDAASAFKTADTQLGGIAQQLDAVGQGIVSDFRTDNRNMFTAQITVTQPIYMGGALVAMNRMAEIAERMTESGAEADRQSTVYSVDNAYWQVVSLSHKRKLAESYLALVRRLDSDMTKMIAEGVATKSDGLTVSVKVNEAEMTLTQVDNGLALSRMMLCQICGLPLEGDITLADETADTLTDGSATAEADGPCTPDARPELQMLEDAVDLTRQTTRLAAAARLPQVLLMGGYGVTNPNGFDSYRNKFAGMWNVGVMVRVPVWTWNDATYKVRASKGLTAISQLELSDTREKMELQVSQSRYKLKEAGKRLTMARTNCSKADENLRSANLGFREGVIESRAVMEAQTAWLKAQSSRIDAEIDLALSRAALKKATGRL